MGWRLGIVSLTSTPSDQKSVEKPFLSSPALALRDDLLLLLEDWAGIKLLRATRARGS